jgi:hypothetical protein
VASTSLEVQELHDDASETVRLDQEVFERASILLGRPWRAKGTQPEQSLK